MTGAVHLQERVRAIAGCGEPWNERELMRRRWSLPGGGSCRKDAVARCEGYRRCAAEGGERGRRRVEARPSSALAGDVLTAHFVRDGWVDHIAEVHGDGHTALRRVSETGW